MQEEERVEVRGEPEQLEEELRKRKRGAEDAEIKLRNERVRILISNKDYVLMEKRLKDRGFIVERGLKKNSSPLSMKCLRREDGNHWANTRHLVVLHW